jgi:nucleotide-binding universal stress UspA family protein
MLKNLLVLIPSERSIRPIADSAISLALTHAAHLDAVSIGFETTNVGFSLDGGAALAAAFEMDHEVAVARANAALAVFEAEARNADVPYGRRLITGFPAETEAAAGSLARLYDLTVALQPEPDRDTADNDVPAQLLLQSGGPVLFIPYTHKGPFEARHVGIAWDGSRLAARAVRDAAPFLARAQAISIVSLNEADLPADVSAAALVAHLARRGLTAKVECMEADRADIQPLISSIASDIGLDLIVMGGYGHSPLNERILGGVTRGMLRSMTVSTLMSH